MTALRDCTDPATWWPHVDEATKALAVGGLVVLPTDTVYGIAADAFQPEAVQALLDAKGRGRDMPPPVLIGDVRTMDGLADDIPDAVRELVTQHWPGPLTIILKAQPSLQWDLGETRGTVALRMPDHELTLAVLRRTGPLAVSSANTSGSPAATTAAEAASMLGGSVRVYLDGGDSPGGVASTIVDATGSELRIVREGGLSAVDLGLADAEPEEPVAEEPVAEEAIAEEPVEEKPKPARKPRARAPKPPVEAASGEAPAADAATEEKPEPARKPRTRKPPAAPTADESVEPEGAPEAAPAELGGVEEKPKPVRKPHTRKPPAAPATAITETAAETPEP